MAPPQSLVQAVQQAAPNDILLQQSLLLGSWGESGWSGNLFGFTDPSYGNAASESPSGQVAAILPGYQRAEATLPAGLTGPAAAEYIALGGEAPAFSTPATIGEYGIATYSTNPPIESEVAGHHTWYWDNPAIFGISQQEVIQQTGQPTQYGANRSANAAAISGTWQSIVAAVGGSSQTGTTTSPVPNAGTRSTTGITGSGTNGNGNGNLSGGPGPQGFQGPSAASDLDVPRQNPGFSKQVSASLFQSMNPVIGSTATNATTGQTENTAGIVSDVTGFLTGGFIGSDQYAPLHMIFGVDLPGASEKVLAEPVNNAWNAVKSALVRLGIGLAGLLLMAAGLWIIVNKVSGGATPVPVPV
jgi:hypothetical protein